MHLWIPAGVLPVSTAGFSEILSSAPVSNPVQAIVRQEADKDEWRGSRSHVVEAGG
ncbi:hypothetical protein IE4872_CH03348 [Rhizobium gallicum]|uniref:Uncharacterized protein n=1 Tax=Rhizobium gallicum TaxID=56730 RepID=A0A1L5NM45_9HYPH|nr:hypothetical protein IE4872_CH03348 [Rhizobium gallicum]